MNNISMPSPAELETSLLKALHSMGGTSTNKEIFDFVVGDLKISKSQLEVVRSGNRSEIEYRLAWARTRARKKGMIQRNGPSSWSLLLK